MEKAPAPAPEAPKAPELEEPKEQAEAAETEKAVSMTEAKAIGQAAVAAEVGAF